MQQLEVWRAVGVAMKPQGRTSVISIKGSITSSVVSHLDRTAMGRMYAALLVIRGKHLAALTGLQVLP